MEDSLDTRRRVAATIGAFGFILVVTAVWWGVALWPVAGELPPWLERTRALCFGSEAHGLPSAAGWLMLMGEPIAMLVALMIIAGDAWPAAVTAVTSRASGRVALATLGALLLVALAGTAVRIGGWRPLAAAREAGKTAVPASIERMDRVAPPLELRNQMGETMSLTPFRGRVVLVGFVYGHCETICPTVVHSLLEARSRLGPAAPIVLLVTLDPWRDTPTRLPSIAERWNLGGNAFVLSGDVATVEQTLNAWDVPRSRDEMTGDIVHAVPIYVVNEHGRIVYRVPPLVDLIVDAVRRLPVSG